MELLLALFAPPLPATLLPVEWKVGWRAESWGDGMGVVVAVVAAAAPLHTLPLLWHVTGALVVVCAGLVSCGGVWWRAACVKAGGASCVLLLLLVL